jgi:hypothetical protein
MGEIKTKSFNYGNEKEADWPSQFGTGEKGRFKMVDGKAMEAKEIAKIQHAMASHGIQSTDLMEPTKHPIDGKYYTSASKFRAVTKAHGCEEVGTAYENGYNPEKEAQREWEAHSKAIRKEIFDRHRES